MKIPLIIILSLLISTCHAQEVNIKLVNGFNSAPIKNFRMKFVDEKQNVVDTMSSNNKGELKYIFDESIVIFPDQELEYFRFFPVSVSLGGLNDTIVCYFYPTPQAETKIRKWEEKYPGNRLEDLKYIDDTLILEENQSEFIHKKIQEDTLSEKGDSSILVFDNVIESSFPGGYRELNDFLMENVQYPDVSLINSEHGKIFIRFVIEKNGLVSQIEVIRGISPAIDAEGIRVIRKMPKWNPAFSNGEPVRVKMTLPITFNLR